MSAIASPTRSISRRRERIDRGRWVSIRPIERTDASALSDFYESLSPESRRRRFLNSGRMPDGVATLAVEGEGLVAILEEAGPMDGAVVGHASVQDDGCGGAEAAFAVADRLQGRGLGRQLMAMAVELARLRGHRYLRAALFAGNTAMRRLLLGTGCEVVGDAIDAGIEEMTLRLEPLRA